MGIIEAPQEQGSPQESARNPKRETRVDHPARESLAVRKERKDT
jgi:hypothetical protein